VQHNPKRAQTKYVLAAVTYGSSTGTTSIGTLMIVSSCQTLQGHTIVHGDTRLVVAKDGPSHIAAPSEGARQSECLKYELISGRQSGVDMQPAPWNVSSSA
jgi:hypothetical protein